MDVRSARISCETIMEVRLTGSELRTLRDGGELFDNLRNSISYGKMREYYASEL